MHPECFLWQQHFFRRPTNISKRVCVVPLAPKQLTRSSALQVDCQTVTTDLQSTVETAEAHALTICHRYLQARAYPGIARGISNHAYSYHEDWTRRHMAFPQTPYIAYVCLCTNRRMYSIKCGVANSCPGTHTALQVPIPSALW